MPDLKNIDPQIAPRDLNNARPLDKKIADWMTSLRDMIRARDIEGNGDPNGVYDGRPGTLYRRRDGGAGTSLYVKESAGGTLTGWSAL